ncbi:MAG: DUF503 domain-containing protein [Desulfotomaculaceae bacterium]|nr:DUF503 domain-containing protein [Desulfotomaculaceae bacterium]MDD4766450.1 DUF503 domain-containing protein [Desulfotomaculaceae bacterium]
MIIGVLTLQLHLGEANSLKDKRRILKSLIARIKNRFNVSVAEVGQQELWQCSTLGISMVSCEQAHVHKVLAAVVNFVEAQGSVLITNFQTELL